MAFGAPVLALVLFLMLPDSKVSMRLFFIALPGCVIGFAACLSHLRPKGNGITGFLFLLVWFGFALPVYKDYQQISNADLRGLAERLQGNKVVTYGQMADVNAYYFTYATVQRHRPSSEMEWQAMRDADYIVRGTNEDKPLDPDLVEMNFEVVETLPTWRDRHPIFRVWARTRAQE